MCRETISLKPIRPVHAAKPAHRLVAPTPSKVQLKHTDVRWRTDPTPLVWPCQNKSNSCLLCLPFMLLATHSFRYDPLCRVLLPPIAHGTRLAATCQLHVRVLVLINNNNCTQLGFTRVGSSIEQC